MKANTSRVGVDSDAGGRQLLREARNVEMVVEQMTWSLGFSTLVTIFWLDDAMAPISRF